MRSKPLAMLLAAGVLALLAACGPPTARDVRTPMQAIKVAVDKYSTVELGFGR